jgi:hypothetical protein
MYFIIIIEILFSNVKNEKIFFKSQIDAKGVSITNTMPELMEGESSISTGSPMNNNNYPYFRSITGIFRLPMGNIYSSKINPDLNCNQILWRELSRKSNLSVDSLAFNKIERYDLIKIGIFKLFISDCVVNYQNPSSEESYSLGEKPVCFDFENSIQNDYNEFNKFYKLNGSSKNVLKFRFNLKNLDNNFPENVNLKDKNQITCRICYYQKSTSEDPLISLCNCTGSVRYIHYGCLQKWLYTRLKIKENKNVMTIKCKLYCEICKSPLPSKFLLNY